jgi:hypothetical protein
VVFDAVLPACVDRICLAQHKACQKRRHYIYDGEKFVTTKYGEKFNCVEYEKIFEEKQADNYRQQGNDKNPSLPRIRLIDWLVTLTQRRHNVPKSSKVNHRNFGAKVLMSTRFELSRNIRDQGA